MEYYYCPHCDHLTSVEVTNGRYTCNVCRKYVKAMEVDARVNAYKRLQQETKKKQQEETKVKQNNQGNNTEHFAKTKPYMYHCPHCAHNGYTKNLTNARCSQCSKKIDDSLIIVNTQYTKLTTDNETPKRKTSIDVSNTVSQHVELIYADKQDNVNHTNTAGFYQSIVTTPNTTEPIKVDGLTPRDIRNDGITYHHEATPEQIPNTEIYPGDFELESTRDYDSLEEKGVFVQPHDLNEQLERDKLRREQEIGITKYQEPEKEYISRFWVYTCLILFILLIIFIGYQLYLLF